MNHQDFISELLKDPFFNQRYRLHKSRLKFLISKMLIDARKSKGMTQKDLAKALGTTQSSIARLESGNNLPGLDLLKRIADVYETDLIPPRLEFLQDPFREIMLNVSNLTLTNSWDVKSAPFLMEFSSVETRQDTKNTKNLSFSPTL